MPELGGRDLLGEWQRLMESVIRGMASAAGRPEIPRQLLEPIERQLEIVKELIERERKLQAEVAGALVGPVDAVFDLLEEGGATLRAQAEALAAAGQALEDTAGLMKRQAELFEHAIGALRQPAELARELAGPERPPRDR